MAHGPHSNDEKIVYVGDSRVRKKTHRPDPADYTAYPGKSEAFIPNFLLKEWMVGAVVLVGFLMLVMSHPAPLGYPADPTNTAIIPMPDWYFLFMYQLLKYPYASEDYLVFGTVIVPGIMFGALLLAPFLDTGKERRFYKRPMASSLMLVTLAAVTYLTVYSWVHYQHELERQGLVPDHIRAEEERQRAREEGREPDTANRPNQQPIAIVGEDEEGYEIYTRATCATCHMPDLNGNPSLLGIGDKHDKEGILAIIHEGVGGMPAQYEDNIAKGLTDEEIDTLAEWLAKQSANPEE
ncbi:menaquinol-cytochrome c reductase cytochrome b/c subunit [Paenibacillus senegalensis]|uniref:menaquinol-cytochrome c reductase cytochrome b/c subunit n=1 Tax=Paenibacillus senegalensis TaxID=1465766 RepID=UPI000289F0F0|nr:menaquinol-cytochrome c reductase cytochrome b/c subunit [Paenibacillus senegalensis]